MSLTLPSCNIQETQIMKKKGFKKEFLNETEKLNLKVMNSNLKKELREFLKFNF